MRLQLLLALCLSGVGIAHAEAPRVFRAAVAPLTADERVRMTGRSWHAGCPTPLDDLVSIRMDYLGYDGAVHDGVLVINRRLAGETVAIFHSLFDAGFRIERMKPYEDFAIGEYAAHNDTVGFYCRPAQDDPKIFSWHAYGAAVDINPLTNPYHDPKEGWWPAGSAANAGRDRAPQGLLTAGSDAVRVFMDHGWAWGGMYQGAPDYMHFGKVTIGNGSNPMDRPVWVDRLSYAPKANP